MTLLVRGSTLGASMSQYLVSKVSELDNVDVRTGTEVVGLEADTRLRAVVLSSHDETGLTRLPAGVAVRLHRRRTAHARAHDGGARDRRRRLHPHGRRASPRRPVRSTSGRSSRSPLPLETNRPGFFAAGDVRSGSIKRCSAAIGEGSMAVALVHRRLAELGAE